jgi:hypothetical protein
MDNDCSFSYTPDFKTHRESCLTRDSVLAYGWNQRAEQIANKCNEGITELVIQ